MGSFSGLGIGLSFVFGCILMALVAEVYYLLYWKKKTGDSSNSREIEEFCCLFSWRKPTSFNSTTTTQELTNSHPQEQEDLEMGTPNKELGLKGYNCEEGIETELMRVHNLCGPPRFLFTIKEESREDLELSDDGKSRKGSRTRSLSDLVFGVDGIGTPFLTPLSSPTVKSPNSYSNPLFEEEINRLRSSPPPKFKFLKDAEDKLLKKLLREEADKKMGLKDQDSQNPFQEAGFVSVISVREHLHNQPSRVLPLADD